MGRAERHPAPPGRHRVRQQAGHLRRRPRPLAAAAGRRPRHRPGAPLRLPPPGVRRRPGGRADQPEPRRPGVRGLRAGRAGRRRDRPRHRAGRAAPGAVPLRPRGHRDSPTSAGHRAPPRLLPGVGLAGRHGARRRGDRPRGAAARRAGDAVRPEGGVLGASLPRRRVDRHPQPVRRRRPRPRQPARGHAASSRTATCPSPARRWSPTSRPRSGRASGRHSTTRSVPRST